MVDVFSDNKDAAFCYAHRGSGLRWAALLFIDFLFTIGGWEGTIHMGQHTAPKILAFAGSTRTDSYNKLLVKAAIQGAKAAGAEVTVIDLRDFSLPLYDGDLEEQSGLPENARRLKALFLSHQGLLIASPEYNSSISAVLKNAIDWVSRPVEGEVPLAGFRGKVCSLMSASPGALGGLRGLVTVRSILGNLGVIVLPDQIAVGKSHEAFDAQGQLSDAKQRASVEALGANVAHLLLQMQSPLPQTASVS
jgi:chromate reductase